MLPWRIAWTQCSCSGRLRTTDWPLPFDRLRCCGAWLAAEGGPAATGASASSCTTTALGFASPAWVRHGLDICDRPRARVRRGAEHGVAPEAVAEAYHSFEQGGSQISPLSAAAVSNQTIQESQRLLLLVRAYQARPRSCTPQSRKHARAGALLSALQPARRALVFLWGAALSCTGAGASRTCSG